MTDQGGNIHFEPVNAGQALGVLADIVATYVGATISPAIEDKKVASQLNVTIFLHSLLMRSRHKAEMANLLDIISAELRAAGEADADAEGGDPTTTDLLKPNGNDGVVNAEICELALLLVGDERVNRETIDTWSADQLAQAYDWAMRVHLQASDNDDVVVPTRPDFIPARSIGTG